MEEVSTGEVRIADAGTVLTASEQQLTAVNQQLMASEQQWRALNQRLKASEQRLKAANQQLTASEQQLRAANQLLMASDQQLRAANSELAANEQALRESEGRYRSLFNNMGEGVALHRVHRDAEGRATNYEILAVNPQYEAIVGLRASDVIGRPASEVYGTPTAPYLEDYARVADTGMPYRFESYFPPLRKHFEIVVTSFEQGSFATVFSDITERKHAAETVRLNTRRYEILWDIARHRSDTLERFLEHALEKAVELTDSDFGYLYRLLTPGGDLALSACSSKVTLDRGVSPAAPVSPFAPFDENLRQGRTVTVNDPADRKACLSNLPPGPFPVKRFMLFPVVVEGVVEAVVGLANKSDDYHDEDERQLTLFMDAVWRIVEQKQAEEHRRSLETQMQKLESLGLLAGGIAHDFNNLLTAIMSNVSLTAVLLEPQHRAIPRLAEAERACVRARDLTQQLLTFARGGTPVRKNVRLDEIIRDSARFAVRGTGVDCRFHFGPGPCVVDADEGQISQVIHNLVLNGVQAMSGTGTVTLATRTIEIGEHHDLPLQPGHYVEVTAKDEGVGISPEHLGRVFDPYFTTKQKGSGLGLAVTYSILQNHGGFITVDSTPGGGSSFRFYVPAAADLEAAREAEGSRVLYGRGRILVMDDDDLVRDVAQAILQQLGYDCETVPDGRRLLERYQAVQASGGRTDLVIMDLTVPGGMGGREAMLQLRAMDPHVRAIVSSGYSQDPIMSEYERYGFQGVVAKPYTVQVLSEAVGRLVQAPPTRRESAGSSLLP